MAGFRPGKVPLKVVAQQYGPQVRSEVLGDAVQKAFSDAVREQNLQVAGYPRIEPKDGAATPRPRVQRDLRGLPEVELGDVSARHDRAADARRRRRRGRQDPRNPAQAARARSRRRERAAATGDRVTIDFVGTHRRRRVPGRQGRAISLVLGEGRMLPDFEASVARHEGGRDAKSFEVKFPGRLSRQGSGRQNRRVRRRASSRSRSRSCRSSMPSSPSAGRRRRRSGQDARRSAGQPRARGEEAPRGAPQGPGDAGAARRAPSSRCRKSLVEMEIQRLVRARARRTARRAA